ncbi:unnamed protein product [Ectocarpus sp. CCAP 1310/34]|nr:unnamed protein product [Ectocarpus sp. CCAP 1310/34]
MNEESIIAGAAAAASSLQNINIMHTFDSDGEHDDQEPGGLFGDLLVEEEEEEEEEEERAKIFFKDLVTINMGLSAQFFSVEILTEEKESRGSGGGGEETATGH